MRPSSEKIEVRSVPVTPLLKHLECAVCLSALQVPFKMCNRGHLICSQCMKTLPDCPTCHAPVTIENPVAIKNIFESLPRQCRFFINDCDAIVEPQSGHEEYCSFRDTLCRFCNKPVVFKSMKTHLSTIHKSKDLTTFPKGTVVFHNFKQTIPMSKVATISIPTFGRGNIFWIDLKSLTPNSPNMLQVRVMGEFAEKPKLEYAVTLKFMKDGLGFIHSLKVLKSHDEKEAVHATMQVPIHLLDPFIDSLGNLVFNYHFQQKVKSV